MGKKNATNPLKCMDILILCGGLGTRLRAVVSDRPKPMAEVEGRPFLEILVENLLCQGFRKIIFCTGHLGDQIEKYFTKHPYAKNAEFQFVREEKLLGTGGAIKNAFKLVKSAHFFVINGDTASRINFSDMYACHINKRLPLSIALVERRLSNGQGNVLLAKNGVISSFVEDFKKNMNGFSNAGCYVMSKDIEKFFPVQDTFSLERDMFPKLIGKSYGFVFDGKFLDIGTPERYSLARQGFLTNV